MPNLLPDDFGTEIQTPPVAILREQAENLTKAMRGLIVARVATTKHGHGFRHLFLLEVPTLDDYVYTLFSVTHDLLLYPVELQFLEYDTQRFAGLGNPEQFENALRFIFADAKTKKIITALKVQVEAEVKQS